MPYIQTVRRERLDGDDKMLDAGELNYELTLVIKKYLEFHGTRYRTLNDILRALEGAKSEFYRRVVVPYEDTKIKENGDVY